MMIIPLPSLSKLCWSINIPNVRFNAKILCNCYSIDEQLNHYLYKGQDWSLYEDSSVNFLHAWGNIFKEFLFNDVWTLCVTCRPPQRQHLILAKTHLSVSASTSLTLVDHCPILDPCSSWKKSVCTFQVMRMALIKLYLQPSVGTFSFWLFLEYFSLFLPTCLQIIIHVFNADAHLYEPDWHIDMSLSQAYHIWRLYLTKRYFEYISFFYRINTAEKCLGWSHSLYASQENN